MPEEMRRSFERWYRDQTRGARGNTSPELGKENRLDPAPDAGTGFPGRYPSQPGAAGAGYPALRGELSTAAAAHFSRTRIRTSFDPDLEIPRLQRWFEDNQHPTRDQMIFYLNELNSLESRRGRKPLDLTNIIYWFKNARAAQRRAAHRSPETENAADPDAEVDLDESLEERLSPEPVKREAPQQQEQQQQTGSPAAQTPADAECVPILPNRNAVYVVNEPLHMYKKEDSETDSNVLHIEPEDPAEQKQPEDNNNQVSNNNNSSTSSEADKHPKDSPRESNDSGNGSEPEEGQHLVIEPQSPGSVPQNLSLGGGGTPQNLSVGVKRGCESLESDLSEDEYEDEYGARYGEGRGRFGRTNGHRKLDGSGDSDRGSPSPSGSPAHGMSPLNHSALLPTSHPLLSGTSHHHHPHHTHPTQHQQPPPAHQQALQLHPSAHLPHPLNMHLFPHPLYNALDASALIAAGGAAPKSFKDAPSPTSLSDDHRKKRSRVFIDPLTEIPKLEKWFLEDTHPSSYMIEKYTEDLNRSDYRQRFPKLEPKNVQLWFKNHRAKVKRQRFEHSAELLHQQHSTPAPADLDLPAQGAVHKYEEVHAAAQ